MSLRLIFILLLFPLLAIPQEGDFKWQNPLPQGNNLFGCSCASGHYAWAVGSAGTIIKSSDMGANWTIQSSGVFEQLNEVSFVDSLTGWACGNYATILHTGDGGENWEEQTVPSFWQTLNDVQFINKDTGRVTGMYGSIFQSTDGGNTWILQNSNTTENLFSIHFTDALHGFAAGNNGAFVKTSDGGETWQSSSYFNEDYVFYSLYFINPDTGWMCGSVDQWLDHTGVFARTTDGGVTWDTTMLGYHHPRDIYFTDNQRGYIVSGSSSIFETIDGGESWNLHSWGGYIVFESISFFDENLGLSVGYRAQIIRRIGGPFYTWEFNDTGTTESLDDIVFVNDSAGWAIGYSDSLVLHTEDGGDTWYPYATGLEDIHSPSSITFPDHQNGWISGTGGMILHTNDGGYTWNRQISTTYRTLFSIFFVDENHGWAVGEDDIRLRTTDGGQTWFGFPSGAEDYLWGVFFVDILTGWVVGDDGLINKTTNGGANWTVQNSNTDEHLRNVYFTDPLNGWAIGDNSTILRTADGGTVWTQVPCNAGGILWDILFTSAQEGWISGSDGVILHTTDGGSTWNMQDKTTTNSLYSMYFTGPNDGWFCGFNGTILKYQAENPVLIEEDENNQKTHFHQSLNIFPNPCQAGSEIRLTPGNFERITLYDLQGRPIKIISIIESGISYNQDIIINLDDITPGVYLVKAGDEKNSPVNKLIIF